MKYPDYTETQSSLQYKDLRVGNDSPPRMGEIMVVDWDGYTIGYYGRIFEARNKTKGGSFEGQICSDSASGTVNGATSDSDDEFEDLR